MPVDRALLKQALTELVRLKTGTESPRRFLAQLYSSALTEWAGQLGLDQRKLNKLDYVSRVVSGKRLH